MILRGFLISWGSRSRSLNPCRRSKMLTAFNFGWLGSRTGHPINLSRLPSQLHDRYGVSFKLRSHALEIDIKSTTANELASCAQRFRERVFLGKAPEKSRPHSRSCSPLG